MGNFPHKKFLHSKNGGKLFTDPGPVFDFRKLIAQVIAHRKNSCTIQRQEKKNHAPENCPTPSPLTTLKKINGLYLN